MLQTVANTVENTMENERFELKTVAHTVEMAVSSSKMLQIGMENGENRKSKKNSPPPKKSPNNFLPICNLNPQAMKLAMKFGTFKHGWQVPEP